jgi:D-arginine dehydrogenase
VAVVDCDFLVIGAGIAGVSTAWRLAAVGRTILLEGERQPGYHSTGRSVAIFDRAHGNAAIRALTAASHEFLQAPAFPVRQSILAPRGVLYVADDARLGRLHDFFTAIHGLAPSATIRDGTFATERVSILRQTAVAACVWDPAAADIDVAVLLEGWLQDFRRRGGILQLRAAVEHLEQRGSKWWARTTGGEYSARVIVNAAGAWADEIAVCAGLAPLGLVPRRRTVAVVPVEYSLGAQHWPLAVDVGESWYFKGESGRVLVSPADETATRPGDVLPDEFDIAVGIERFERATNVVVERVARGWAGLRSFFADRTPVLGLDPRAAGFVWCAGLGGYGIQTSPAASAWAAAAACGDSPPAAADVAVLSPDRLISNASNI